MVLDQHFSLPDLQFPHKNERIRLAQKISNVCPFKNHGLFLLPFVKDKVSIGAWIYLWIFCFVPLTYIPVFVTEPYYFDDCSLVV